MQYQHKGIMKYERVAVKYFRELPKGNATRLFPLTYVEDDRPDLSLPRNKQLG
jgi:hypothetical protein